MPIRRIRTIDDNLVPLGYYQNTDQDPAVTLAAIAGGTLPVNAQHALIQAEAASIRWTDDGTTPTASLGILLAAGDDIFYTGDLSAILIFEVTSAAIVNVSFYGAYGVV